jgi:hypothetical protein
VDHRTALATFRTLARRTGTTAGRTALTVAREVTTRIAERRSSRSSTPPSAAHPPPPTAPVRPARATRPVAGREPSPADVARAVARNDAGLPRTNPGPERRRTATRPGPGAKLPARAGHGIVGV